MRQRRQSRTAHLILIALVISGLVDALFCGALHADGHRHGHEGLPCAAQEAIAADHACHHDGPALPSPSPGRQDCDHCDGQHHRVVVRSERCLDQLDAAAQPVAVEFLESPADPTPRAPVSVAPDRPPQFLVTLQATVLLV